MTNCRAKMVEGFLATPGLTCAFRVDLPGGRHRLRTLIAARNFETIQIKPFGLSELPFGGKRCPQEICSWKCQGLIIPLSRRSYANVSRVVQSSSPPGPSDCRQEIVFIRLIQRLCLHDSPS